MLLMEHPDLGPDRQQETTEEQFELIWKEVGWFVVTEGYESPAAAAAAAVPVPSWEVDEETDVVAAVANPEEEK